MRVQAESKGLKISYEIKEKEHNALYNADAFRIRQILDNLISNAIKYTDKGSIMVSMSIRQKRNAYNIIENKNAYLLTLDVTDTGKGMTTEERQKVFQAFTRLKNAQGIEGTGLGLSITHELATLLGGEIHVKSEVGKGSTFTATIPIELADTSQTKVCHSHNELDEKPSEDAPKTSPSSTEKLLILDDDKLQLQLLQEMLRRTVGDSWQVFACNHVTDALTLLHNEQPAIMLMDIEMPEMSGKDLIKHINHNNMKVIAMTAHDTSIKEELREAGFDDCLFKPFSQESLQKVLHLASEKKSRGFSKKVPRFLKIRREAVRMASATNLSILACNLSSPLPVMTKRLHKRLSRR